MKRDCQHGPRERALKSAFKRLVERCGGVELCAAMTGVSAASISNYGHANTDTFAPVHIVLKLEEAAGVAEVSGLMTQMTQPVAEEAPDLLQVLGSLGGAFGDATRVVMMARADGNVDQAERKAIAAATSALLEQATALHRQAVESV